MDGEPGFGVLLRNHSFAPDEGNCQIIGTFWGPNPPNPNLWCEFLDVVFYFGVRRH